MGDGENRAAVGQFEREPLAKSAANFDAEGGGEVAGTLDEDRGPEVTSRDDHGVVILDV